MSLRRKARNRVLILLAGLILMGGAVGGYLSMKAYRAKTRYAEMRLRGLNAARDGNDQGVINYLGPYLHVYPADTDALAAYAKSRPKVPEPQGEHLRETARVLRRLLQLDPSRVDDWRELMNLYSQFDMLTEANEAASNLLAHSPGDGEALALQADVLLRLKNYPQEIVAATQLLAADPQDWATQIRRLMAYGYQGRTPDFILSTAQSAAEKFPNEQGALTLEGVAYELTNDPANARQKFEQAARAPCRDKTVGDILVEHLDRLAMQQESMAVLQQVAGTGDPAAQRALLRRLWEQNRVADAVQLYAGATTQPSQVTAMAPTTAPADQFSSDLSTALGDSESVGLYADCLRRLNRPQDFVAAMNELAGRKDDATATAWIAIEKDYPADNRQKALELRAACAAAAGRSPHDPYVVFYEGAAAAAVGETDAALDLWTKSAQLSATWPVPLVEEAQVLLLMGRTEVAARAAAEAYRRDRASTAAEVVNALVMYSMVENGNDDPNLISQLNQVIDDVQRPGHVPGEEQTLRMRAALLARTGQTDAAREVVQTLLNRQPPISAKAMLSLAGICRQYKLGLETDCLTTLEKAYGRTPQSAVALAVADYTNHQPDEALRLLQDSISTASGEQVVAYRLALVSYLEAIGDDTTTKKWVELGDQYPSELSVQRAALASRAAYRDRDFFKRTIDRMQALLGDDSNAWKVAKARWLLDGPRTATNITDAMAILQNVLQRDPTSMGGNVLMGTAEEMNGDVAKATSYFAAAQKLDPKSAAMNLDMARLLQYRGDFDSARQQLEQAAREETNPQQLTQTAALMASQGEVDQAIAILVKLTADPKATEASKWLLEDLYCRTKQFDKAQAISDELMKTPDAPTILAAARIDMFQRRPKDADTKLAMLADMKWNPGELEQTLGDFNYSFNQLDRATDYYRAATKAGPTGVSHWMSLLDCQALMGRTSDMVATETDALAQIPNDPTITNVQKVTDLMVKAGDGPTQRRLFSAVVRDPTPSGPAVTTLSTMVQLAQSDESADEVLQAMGKLSQDLPRFLPAQTALIEAQLRLGRPSDAVQAAIRTSAAFPNETYPTQLAVQAYSDMEQWDNALQMAQTWKSRVVGDTLDVDLEIARIELQLSNATAAIAAVQPHQNAAFLSPDQQTHLQSLLAQAMVLQGKAQEAADMLWPAAQKAPELRSDYLKFVVTNLPPAQAAAALTRVSTYLKTEAHSERSQIGLALAWDKLAATPGDNSYGKTARDLVASLEKDPVAGAEAALTAGLFNEEDGDFTAAQASYRLAIQKGDLPYAKNNLAMLLGHHGGSLSEAIDLAHQCIAANSSGPDAATYYDTLAFLLDKSKQYDQAADAMQTALHMQPSNSRWHVNLARMFFEAGHRDKAQQTLQELEVMTPGVRGLPQEYRDQMDALKRQITAANIAAATQPHS